MSRVRPIVRRKILLKVDEFYAKQGLTAVKGKAKAHAVIKKEAVEVAFRGSSRKDMVSGQKDDALITITKLDSRHIAVPFPA